MTYSSSLAHGRKSAGLNRNQNTASFRSRERALGPVSNSVILIVLACLLGLLYLTQVTKTNAFGYKINDLHHYSRDAVQSPQPRRLVQCQLPCRT